MPSPHTRTAYFTTVTTSSSSTGSVLISAPFAAFTVNEAENAAEPVDQRFPRSTFVGPSPAPVASFTERRPKFVIYDGEVLPRQVE